MAGMSNEIPEGDLDLSTVALHDGSRMPKFALTMAWWAVCSAMFYIVVGATLAMTYGAPNAIIGMALSVIAYGLINNVISRYAAETGLSVALFSRVLFGNAGAALATLIFFATAIYYAVFEGSVMAVAASHYFPSISYGVAALVVVCYSVPLIFGSVQHWLDKLNGVLLPFYLLGLFTAVVVALLHYGYNPHWLALGVKPTTPATGWIDCFVYYMGVWVLMMYTFDYARFGRKKDADYHGRFNFGMPFYAVAFLLNGVVGIFLVATVPLDGALSEVSVVLVILKLMGLAGLLFVWITQTRINTANFYLATINMQAFFQKMIGLRWPKSVWALVVGAIVYALMLANVFSYILQALAYQGVFVVAWVGIALTHILSPRYRQMFGSAVEYHSARVPAFNPGGIAAWLISTGLGAMFMRAPGLLHTLSAPLTFVASVLTYSLALAMARPGWYVKQA